MLNSHTWLEAPALDSAVTGHFHHRRKFYWMALSSRITDYYNWKDLCGHLVQLPFHRWRNRSKGAEWLAQGHTAFPSPDRQKSDEHDSPSTSPLSSPHTRSAPKTLLSNLSGPQGWTRWRTRNFFASCTPTLDPFQSHRPSKRCL